MVSVKTTYARSTNTVRNMNSHKMSIPT